MLGQITLSWHQLYLSYSNPIKVSFHLPEDKFHFLKHKFLIVSIKAKMTEKSKFPFPFCPGILVQSPVGLVKKSQLLSQGRSIGKDILSQANFLQSYVWRPYILTLNIEPYRYGILVMRMKMACPLRSILNAVSQLSINFWQFVVPLYSGLISACWAKANRWSDEKMVQ